MTHPEAKTLSLDWEVGHAPAPEATALEYIPARVPGAVQLDWARAHGAPPYWYGDHFKQYRWMEDVYWRYRARLVMPDRAPGERVFFVCGGVDYRFQVFLSGELVHDQEGMFTPFELDLTDRAETGARLEILVFPAPKAHAAPEDRSQARLCNKPPVSYGWDWHPRLIPCGIWRPAYLEVRPRCHVRSVDFRYRLSDDLSDAAITVDVELSAPGAAAWRLLDGRGRTVVAAEGPHARLARPELWWPSGEGEPTLYLLEVLVDGAVAHRQRVGFRRVRLVMHEGAWEHPATFPKSRSHPPITLEVNGRVVFAKGSNWVCPEIFPGAITRETYRPLLELARAAHFNLLRTWGGAIVNPDDFYELCDELGLLVWTEFHLACNLYDGGDDYLRVLDQESRSIIRRVRQHPSLALWCGGNELFNVWSGMTDQSLALRLLNKNCYELDRDTPFIPTAPLDGMGHGDYRFRDERGRDVFQIFAGAAHTAYSEFGCPGPSDVDYLEAFIPNDELFPPRPGTAWEWHHGLKAWSMDAGTWLCRATIEFYFGEARSLEELVRYGQLLQCEGYKCLFEEARRQKPRCAMALSWCFNEPWPSAANNSIVNWPHRPKPAYYAVQAACRPTLASARLPRFLWEDGERFTAELWLLHDGPEPIGPCTVRASLHLDGAIVPLLSWDAPALAPRQNLAGPTVSAVLPALSGKTFSLSLEVPGRPELDSSYTLAYRRTVAKARPAPGQRFLNG